MDKSTLINIINTIQDGLCHTPVKQNISLPQIAVVGSQSAGKSSVLENIVGRSFLPRGTGIVTRRPLIIQLVYGPKEYAEFGHKQRKKYVNFDEVRKEIEIETNKVCGDNKALSNNPIRLKIVSPLNPTLTLIDLPGMTKIAVGDQPSDIPDQIKEMVMSYVKDKNCIILAVTPANTDLANSDALQISRQVDPEGIRTLGVLTKLDLMDEGTDVYDVFTNNSKNTPQLSLGYVGVINRSQKEVEENKSTKEVGKRESDFFSRHHKYSTIRERMGTKYLVERCSNLLGTHIKTNLPHIEAQIYSSLSNQKSQLIEFVGLRPDSKTKKLLQLIQSFYNHFSSNLGKNFNSNIEHDHEKSNIGVQMEEFCKHEFYNKVDSIDVLAIMSPHEVKTLTRNVYGINKALIFSPDQAFHQLTRRNIRLLEPVMYEFAHRIQTMLCNLIKEVLIKEEFHPYTVLRKNISAYMIEIVEQKTKDVKTQFDLLLKYETSNIDPFSSNLDESLLNNVKKNPNEAIIPLSQSYFNAVKERIKNQSFKIVNFIFVQEVVDQLMVELVWKFYKIQLIDNLLQLDNETAERIDAIEKSVKALEAAMNLIQEL